MGRDPSAYLWEIQQAAKAILDFTAGLDFPGYMASDIVRAPGRPRSREPRYHRISQSCDPSLFGDRPCRGLGDHQSLAA